jgi:hypothetical protein
MTNKKQFEDYLAFQPDAPRAFLCAEVKERKEVKTVAQALETAGFRIQKIARFRVYFEDEKNKTFADFYKACSEEKIKSKIDMVMHQYPEGNGTCYEQKPMK